MHDDGSKMFLYFSDLLNRPLSDPEGRIRGRLTDLKVRLGEPFPRVDSLVIRRRGEKSARVLDWSSVETIRGRSAVLKPGSESRLTGLDVGNEEIQLREDLLDKQVVDTHGARIERVNDIHLLIAHGELRIAHVEFGLRGILRRLGWIKTIDAVTDWLFSYRIAEKLVSWKCVQPLASDPKKNLKLNVTVRKLHELHPSDIADIIEELDRANRSSVFRALDTETAAETLQEVDPKLQLSLIETAPPDRASDILETMEPDEAREFLADLPEEKMESLIGTMEPPFRDHVKGLLKHREGTAGSIMTTDFLALRGDQTIADAVESFRNAIHPLETVAYIYITGEDRRLAGVITLRHLLLCDREERLGALMNPHVLMVETDDDIATVADVFNKYKFLAVPVVDRNLVIRGIITLQDIVQATAEEL
jgi:CBS domain-containing protein/sporulation protein YlmC with PRC-barrel domain